MNNILEQWRHKKSWGLTFPFCPIYVSKKTGEKDIFLTNLLSKEDRLTLSLRDSGFNEIGVDWLSGEIPSEYQYLTQPQARIEGIAPEHLASLLLQRIYQYFISVWDSSKFHIVLTGGGLDSRILCYVLTLLREKLGPNWIGDIHFRCCEPESPIFRKLMERQQWPEGCYSVYKEGRIMEKDYFEDLYNFEDNVNAFHLSHLNFYHDLEKYLNLKFSDVQVVSGNGGGEIFDYPSRMSQIDPNNPFANLKKYFEVGRFNFLYDYIKWGDILLPYLSYSYLDLAFRTPKKLMDQSIKVDGVSGLDFNIKKVSTGLMRIEMLKLLGDDLPYYQGHFYNTKISESKRAYVKDAWLKSRFYNDFKDVKEVSEATPQTMNWQNLGLDNQLYSLATVYQGI